MTNDDGKRLSGAAPPDLTAGPGAEIRRTIHESDTSYDFPGADVFLCLQPLWNQARLSCLKEGLPWTDTLYSRPLFTRRTMPELEQLARDYEGRGKKAVILTEGMR